MENKYWLRPEYNRLKAKYSARIAARILLDGCATLAEFCGKYTDVEMLQQPHLGRGTFNRISEFAKAEGITIRRAPPKPDRERILPIPQDHDLFITRVMDAPLCISIGSSRNRRRVWLSDDQAMKLAYRLMSIMHGGTTLGIEQIT